MSLFLRIITGLFGLIEPIIRKFNYFHYFCSFYNAIQTYEIIFPQSCQR